MQSNTRITPKELCMQGIWWDRTAEEVQYYDDSNQSKEFLSSPKAVYGPHKPDTTPLLAADGWKTKRASLNAGKNTFPHSSTDLPLWPKEDWPEAYDRLPWHPSYNRWGKKITSNRSIHEKHQAWMKFLVNFSNRQDQGRFLEQPC